MEFGLGFGGDDVGDLLVECGILCGGEVDGLWKNGGYVVVCDIVEFFVLLMIGWDVEVWDGGVFYVDLGDFFFECEVGDEVVDVFGDREVGVVEFFWKSGCGG